MENFYVFVNGEYRLATEAEKKSNSENENSGPLPLTIEERVAIVETDVAHVKSEMEDFNYIFTGEEKSHAE